MKHDPEKVYTQGWFRHQELLAKRDGYELAEVHVPPRPGFPNGITLRGPKDEIDQVKRNLGLS